MVNNEENFSHGKLTIPEHFWKRWEMENEENVVGEILNKNVEPRATLEHVTKRFPAVVKNSIRINIIAIVILIEVVLLHI